MGKNKLDRFQENKTFACLIQPISTDFIRNDHPLKGKWRNEIFKNTNPLILELGCGKGEYAVGLSRLFPNQNFIGIDIKGARLWRGAKTVHDEEIKNVAFLRTRIDLASSFFDENEVDEIWLTFSDPQPKKERKRLTSPLFIERYKKFLKKEGKIHVKTDSDLLYDYTMEEIQKNNYKLIMHHDNIYNGFLDDQSDEINDILNIKTHYERIWLKDHITIKYITFIP